MCDCLVANTLHLMSTKTHMETDFGAVRLCSAFYHLLVMDGAEVAAALPCDFNQCPVCTCPHSELDGTDRSYPFRDTESLKEAVNPAREEHLDEEGRVLPRHKDDVINI